MSKVVVVKGGRCVRILVVSALLIALAAFFVGFFTHKDKKKQ